jgi:hypothetical protein
MHIYYLKSFPKYGIKTTARKKPTEKLKGTNIPIHNTGWNANIGMLSAQG